MGKYTCRICDEHIDDCLCNQHTIDFVKRLEIENDKLRDGLPEYDEITWIRNLARHWFLLWIGVTLKSWAKKIGIPV